MLQDQKYKHHKHESLKAYSYFKDLIEVFHKLVSFLDYFEHSYHPCHADDLIELTDPGYSCQTVEITENKQQVKRNYRYDVHEKPGVYVFLRDDL